MDVTEDREGCKPRFGLATVRMRDLLRDFVAVDIDRTCDCFVKGARAAYVDRHLVLPAFDAGELAQVQEAGTSVAGGGDS